MKVGMIIIFVIPAADGIKTIFTFLSCPAKLSFTFDTTESNLECSNGDGGIWCTSERRTIKFYGTCNSAAWIAVITEKCLLVQVHLCSSVPAGSWRYHSFLIDLALLLQDQQQNFQGNFLEAGTRSLLIVSCFRRAESSKDNLQVDWLNLKTICPAARLLP